MVFDGYDVHEENIDTQEAVELLNRADDLLSKYAMLLALLDAVFNFGMSGIPQVTELVEQSWLWAHDARTSLGLNGLTEE